MKTRVAAVLAVVGVVAIPAAAEAATKTVTMGPAPKASKQLEKYFVDLLDFYPGNVSVRRGDKVRFVPYGFHNVAFPRKGAKPAAFFAPNGVVSGAADAAGAPFWFNGQPALGPRPELIRMNFGKTVSYSGAKAVNSGLPLARRPKPFTVKFTKQGTFTYYCEVHPPMRGKITVKAANARVPSAKADAARAARELARDVRAAKGVAATKAPANTVLVGSANNGGVESYGIFPSKLTVPAGTAVEFRMKSTARETHTATFGPGNPEKEPNSYLGTLAKSFEGPGPIDARAIYPSEPPGTPTVHTAALHGNGFWNSGLLDANKSTRFPSSARVTFGQPGAYPFYCLIHPFMTGTVTVT